jgi:hypothetical protein
MKRVSVLLKFSLALLICLGAFSVISTASAGGNRCTDRCADRYHYRKNVCKAIPFKRERHRCEDAAKRAKDECKRRCR